MHTTNEAARALGVIPRRVRAMIDSGLLRAEKRGRDWSINREDLIREMEKRGKDPEAEFGD